METTKITTKKKIGMANPLVQKIGNFKKWNIGNCIMQRHWAIGDWRKLVGTIEVTILSKITLIWLISWKINLPFFKSIKVQKLFSFFILKYFTNFVKLVDFFPAKKGCLKRRSQEKVSGVDHRRGSLLGSLLEVSGEVSGHSLRLQFRMIEKCVLFILSFKTSDFIVETQGKKKIWISTMALWVST